MPLPFDATLKDLVQQFLHDYEVQMGLTDLGPLTPLNVDLSTITAATDIALGHGDPPDRVVDINFQSGPDEELPARVLLYNALLHFRFRVPVHSVVVLLRPVADRSQLTGRVRYIGRPRKSKMQFSYEVIRLWEQPVRQWLEGGLGTLPLAPLCRLPPAKSVEAALTPVLRRMTERLEHEASREERAKLLTAAYVLLGLRVRPEMAERLFQGVRSMKESSTYQAILAEGRREGWQEGRQEGRQEGLQEGRQEGRQEGQREGRLEALRITILRLGRRQFHKPASKSIQAKIEAITDVARLEHMVDRILDADGWDELLSTP